MLATRSPVIHNLEHGASAVSYGLEISAEEVAAISAWYQESPLGMIVDRRDDLGGEVVGRAWGHLLRCPRVGEAVFSAFRDAYRAKGPERFPLEDLRPGTWGEEWFEIDRKRGLGRQTGRTG